MTTYVLIIITTFVGYNKGNITVTTQEFNSLETCKEAGNAILKNQGEIDIKGYLGYTQYKTFCTKK